MTMPPPDDGEVVVWAGVHVEVPWACTTQATAHYNTVEREGHDWVGRCIACSRNDPESYLVAVEHQATILGKVST